MKIPAKNTTANRMMHLLYEQGAMTLEMLVDALPGVPRRSIIGAATSYHLCSKVRGSYELPVNLRHHLNDCQRQQVAEVAPKVTPRTFNIWTSQLTGYEAAMRKTMRA